MAHCNAQDFLVSQKVGKNCLIAASGLGEWYLKTEHAGGCFEGRLEYRALSLGTGRESKNVKGV